MYSLYCIRPSLHMSTWVHWYVSTWIHEYMSTWVHEYTSTWVHKYMSKFVHEYMSTWVHEYINTWVHDCMSTWVHECMSTWVYEYMSTWVHYYLDRDTCRTLPSSPTSRDSRGWSRSWIWTKFIFRKILIFSSLLFTKQIIGISKVELLKSW